MSIELKGNNYYSRVFKKANYKLQNSMFWVVIKVGHFHCMMDEHILEHSSFGAFCISVCSLSHAGAYLVLREHQPFSELSFTFGSSCWPLRVAYLGIPSFPKIIRPCTCFIIFWPNCRSLWVVILGHIPSCWVCLHHYPRYPLALGHLIRSPSCQFSLSQGHNFIDRPSCEFSLSQCAFLGPHLYRSVTCLVSLSSVWVFFRRTHIDRPFSC